MSIPSSPKAPAVLKALALGITCSVVLLLPAWKCFVTEALDDPDVWWHLRSAQWIVEHRALPTVDEFSYHGSGTPWAAYSWLAELLLYALYQGLGLRGLLLYTGAMAAAIVAAMFLLIRRLGVSPVRACLMSVIATLGMLPLFSPRPWLFSILLFIIELDLLLTASRTGNRRLLLWLVPLFALWANTHIQCMTGLMLLGLAVVEPLLARTVLGRWATPDSRSMPLGWMVLVFALCLAATLCNPYHYQLFFVALELLGQTRLWNKIQELTAMPFRTWADWAVLAVTVTAAFAMGWRRRVRPLLLGVFLVSVYCSFRSGRDMWMALVTGLASLGYLLGEPAEKRPTAGPARRPAWGWALAAAVVVGVLVCWAWTDEGSLEKKIARLYPSAAVQFLAAENLPGPMYNVFHWGGYLMYFLPEVPVGLDGRTLVHGEDRILRSAKALVGLEGWRDDPDLAEARLVVLPRECALAGLLGCDDRFRLAYQDDVASVFRAADPHPNVAMQQKDRP